MSQEFDVVVIGAGPGGYIAAIRAAQLGLDVACVEKEPVLGGTCLRIGCIPSKAMLESSELLREAREGLAAHGVRIERVDLDLATMLKRKNDVVRANTSGVEFLFKKNKVTRYLGTARFSGPGKLAVGSDELAAKHFVVATGSVSAPLRGVELDGDRIATSTEALSWTEVPASLVVIGAGAIGLELGSVWSRLGAKVTVLEYLDRILPGMDAEIAGEAHKVLKKQGLVFRLGARVTSARVKGAKCTVEAEGLDPIECDRVLLAVGRKPNTEGLDLAAIGVALDEKGRIPVDDRFKTSAEGVYAIGDVIRGPMLAHKAEDEGVACVEGIVTGYAHVNYDAIPNVVYTAPEVASVGKTEEELKQAGIEYRKGSFPFTANGRARALGHTEGRVKILADAKTDRVLGVHILGARAGDLIAEAVAAIEFGATSEDIARTSHAHPTLAEAMREAALAVDGRALNA
ncbi:MAG TPA: dihydrolipoyl dehydrogenase [Planctomycetota bacterium]|nr:dihydrolipoyl dehydrogenase [Planctomycetota bacterium]